MQDNIVSVKRRQMSNKLVMYNPHASSALMSTGSTIGGELRDAPQAVAARCQVVYLLRRLPGSGPVRTRIPTCIVAGVDFGLYRQNC